jgi:hypothetical protein
VDPREALLHLRRAAATMLSRMELSGRLVLPWLWTEWQELLRLRTPARPARRRYLTQVFSFQEPPRLGARETGAARSPAQTVRPPMSQPNAPRVGPQQFRWLMKRPSKLQQQCTNKPI